VGGNQARFGQPTQSRRTLTFSLTVTRRHKLPATEAAAGLHAETTLDEQPHTGRNRREEGRSNLCFLRCLLFKTLPSNREWTPMHANAA